MFILAWILGIMAVPLYAGLIGFACVVGWVAAVHYNKSVFSFFGLALTLAVGMLAFGFDPLAFILVHYWVTLMAVVGYIVIEMHYLVHQKIGRKQPEVRDRLGQYRSKILHVPNF